MKVINFEEAKANLEKYAQHCLESPVIVTVNGKPAFELLPIQTDDPDFIDRLLEENPGFRRLMRERRRESDRGQVSSLEEVRRRLTRPTGKTKKRPKP